MQHRDDEGDAANGDGEGMTGHASFAVIEFREMKIQPSRKRALKHKEILGAYVPTREVPGNNLKVTEARSVTRARY